MILHGTLHDRRQLSSRAASVGLRGGRQCCFDSLSRHHRTRGIGRHRRLHESIGKLLSRLIRNCRRGSVWCAGWRSNSRIDRLSRWRVRGRVRAGCCDRIRSGHGGRHVTLRSTPRRLLSSVRGSARRVDRRIRCFTCRWRLRRCLNLSRQLGRCLQRLWSGTERRADGQIHARRRQ